MFGTLALINSAGKGLKTNKEATILNNKLQKSRGIK